MHGSPSLLLTLRRGLKRLHLPEGTRWSQYPAAPVTQRRVARAEGQPSALPWVSPRGWPEKSSKLGSMWWGPQSCHLLVPWGLQFSGLSQHPGQNPQERRFCWRHVSGSGRVCSHSDVQVESGRTAETSSGVPERGSTCGSAPAHA